MDINESLQQNLAVRIGISGIDEFSNQLKNGFIHTKDSLKNIASSVNDEMSRTLDSLQGNISNVFSSIDGNAQSTGSFLEQTINGHADMMNEIGDSYKNYLQITDPKKMKKMYKYMDKNFRKLRHSAVIWGEASGISADNVVNFRKQLMIASKDVDGSTKLFQSMYEISPKKAKGFWKENAKFWGDQLDEFGTVSGKMLNLLGQDSKKVGAVLNEVLKYGGDASSLTERKKILLEGMGDFEELAKSLTGGTFDEKDMKNYFKSLNKEIFLLQRSGFSEEEVKANAANIAKFQTLLLSKNKNNLLYQDGAFEELMTQNAGFQNTLSMMGVDRQELVSKLETKGLTGIIAEMQNKFKDPKEYKRWSKNFLPMMQRLTGEIVGDEMMGTMSSLMNRPLKNVQENVRYYNEENRKAMLSNETLAKKVTAHNKKYFKGAIRTAEDYAAYLDKLNENDIIKLTQTETGKYIKDHANRLRSYTKSALKLAEDSDTYFAGSLIKKFSAMKRMGIMGLFVPTNGKGQISQLNTQLMEMADVMSDLLMKTAPLITAMGALGFRFQHLGKIAMPITGPFKLLNNLSFGLLGTFGKLGGAIGAVAYGLGKIDEDKLKAFLSGDTEEVGSFLDKLKEKVSYDAVRVLLKGQIINDLKTIRGKGWEKKFNEGKYDDMLVSRAVIEKAYKKGDITSMRKIARVYGISMPNIKDAKDIEKLRSVLLEESNKKAGVMLEKEIKKRADEIIKIVNNGLGVAGRMIDIIWKRFKLQLMGGATKDGELVEPLFYRVRRGLIGFWGKVRSGEVFTQGKTDKKEINDRFKGALAIALLAGLSSKSVRNAVFSNLVTTVKGAMNLARRPLSRMANTLFGTLFRSKIFMIPMGIMLAGAGYDFIKKLQDPKKREQFITTVETKLGLEQGTLSSLNNFGNFFDETIIPSISSFVSNAGELISTGIEKTSTFFINHILPKIPGAMVSGIKLAGKLLWKGTKAIFSKKGFLILAVVAGFKMMKMIMVSGWNRVRDAILLKVRGTLVPGTNQYIGGVTGVGGLSSRIRGRIRPVGVAGMVTTIAYQVSQGFEDYTNNGDIAGTVGSVLTSIGGMAMMFNPLVGMAVMGVGALIKMANEQGPSPMTVEALRKKMATNEVYINAISRWNADMLMMSVADPGLRKMIYDKMKKEMIKMIKKEKMGKKAADEFIGVSMLSKEVVNDTDFDLSKALNDLQSVRDKGLKEAARTEFMRKKMGLVYKMSSVLDFSSGWWGIGGLKTWKEKDAEAYAKDYIKKYNERKDVWKVNADRIFSNLDEENKTINALAVLVKDAKKGGFKIQEVIGNTIVAFDSLKDTDNLFRAYNDAIDKAGGITEFQSLQTDRSNMALDEYKYLVEKGKSLMDIKGIEGLTSKVLKAKGDTNVFAQNLLNLDSTIGEIARHTGLDKSKIQELYKNNFQKILGIQFDNYADLTKYIGNLSSKDVKKVKEKMLVVSGRYNLGVAQKTEQMLKEMRKNKALLDRTSGFKTRLREFNKLKLTTITKDQYGNEKGKFEKASKVVKWNQKQLFNTEKQKEIDKKSKKLLLESNYDYNQYKMFFMMRNKLEIGKDGKITGRGRSLGGGKTGKKELNINPSNLEITIRKSYEDAMSFREKTMVDYEKKYAILKERGMLSADDIYKQEQESFRYATENTKKVLTISMGLVNSNIMKMKDATFLSGEERLTMISKFAKDEAGIYDRLASSRSEIDRNMATSLQQANKDILIETLGGVEKAEQIFQDKGLNLTEFSMDKMTEFTTALSKEQRINYLNNLKLYQEQSSKMGSMLDSDLSRFTNSLRGVASNMLTGLAQKYEVAAKLKALLDKGDSRGIAKLRKEEENKDKYKKVMTKSIYSKLKQKGIDVDADMRNRIDKYLLKKIITKDDIFKERVSSTFFKKMEKDNVFLSKNQRLAKFRKYQIQRRRERSEELGNITSKKDYNEKMVFDKRADLTIKYDFKKDKRLTRIYNEIASIDKKAGITQAEIDAYLKTGGRKAKKNFSYLMNKEKIIRDKMESRKNGKDIIKKDKKAKDGKDKIQEKKEQIEKDKMIISKQSESRYTDEQIKAMASNENNMKILQDKFGEMNNSLSQLLYLFKSGKATMIVRKSGTVT